MKNNESFKSFDPSAKFNSSQNNSDANFFLEYRESGGMDRYTQGDKAGEVLRIYPSGRVELLNLIYTAEHEETKYTEQTAVRHSFSEQKLSEIEEVMNANNIEEWPARLPNVSPLEVRFRTPAPSVRIFYKNQKTGEKINIIAFMGADKKYYPDGFFKIYGFFNNIVREIRD